MSRAVWLCALPTVTLLSLLGGNAWLRSSAPPSPSELICIMTHALSQLYKCKTDAECNKYLQCTLDCQKLSDAKRCPCSYYCQMQGAHNKKFTDYIDATMPCLKEYTCPVDGTCLAEDKDALQNITSLDQIAGDWWVLRGVNCGQQTATLEDVAAKFFARRRLEADSPSLNPTPGKSYPGGYDWLPCQHERIVRSNHKYPFPTSEWVNNITYCAGENGGMKECKSPIIDTVANISLPSPGVIFHNYTDAPVNPQEEYWRIISHPHQDYMMLLWCGSIRKDFLVYNGGLTLSKKRNEANMPAYVHKAFEEAGAKHGVVYSQMCPSTNEGCP
eukprot:TRINITY_DN4190_c0_g1_i1.p1 TRINITY_DN4190_c0_g1~~TRINITY_DN4190_c0_g1_i1.p1  ORF type:complete len:330 (-),score=82.56 TRINITY_DN4190_c0_g1_i1:162-1151(-)